MVFIDCRCSADPLLIADLLKAWFLNPVLGVPNLLIRLEDLLVNYDTDIHMTHEYNSIWGNKNSNEHIHKVVL
jgi:hypothetical protein